ncbi:MAG: hypothetical protein KBT06_06965, partial [Prevotellaceae bacterium]|nr:hypothetical protein [Candidatus Colivivens equi]
IAMRTVRRGEKQETEMVAEANCDFMTVFMLSDQRASGALLFSGILWMIGSLWYMRKFKPELLVEGLNYGGLIYGPVKQNWTDSLGYWLNSNKLMSFAREVIKTRGNRIENQDVIDAIAGWGLADENGYILIPVMHRNSNDDVDILCKSITNKLSNAIKNYCKTWYSAYNLSSERLGQIVFYHEVMWDLLEILEFKGLIAMPPILKGEEVGKQHFGDICFIVIDDSNE